MAKDSTPEAPARMPLKALALILGIITFSSCVALRYHAEAVPEVAGAEFVGTETCSACHEKEVKNFKRTNHARLFIPGAEEVGQAGCEACHGPGSLHVEAEGKGHIVNPHKNSENCFICHMDKHADFGLPYAHPVKQHGMSCVSCHDPHGHDPSKTHKVALGGQNSSSCVECHREQTTVKVFEHEAMREGCTACHSPHGSINKKMLVQNDNTLCLKCHAQVMSNQHGLSEAIEIGTRNHRNFINSRTCWTAGCHTAVHGSNINPHLRY
jgi:predicted CXXCH cytochrome family protein